jgi:4-hydroxy-tetrahydrodipicolinate synthase
MTAGVLPVVYSFFTDSGSFDLDAHERQIAWVRSNGAAGVTLFGLASEGAALSPDERLLILAQTCKNLTAQEALLVTVRPDDDIRLLSRCAIDNRGQVALIVQIGADAAASLHQIDKLVADPGLARRVDLGLQLAPGLIDTKFSAGSLTAYPALLERLSFLKAEYNSIELSAHLAAIGQPLDLLVGRHGQNLIEYLRIGAVGVIPGTEMTLALKHILYQWMAGQHSQAVQVYCRAAPYVDFAMQDLDTVIDVGRAITARALDMKLGRRRRPSNVDAPSFQRAIEAWWPYWQMMCGRQTEPEFGDLHRASLAIAYAGVDRDQTHPKDGHEST